MNNNKANAKIVLSLTNILIYEIIMLAIIMTCYVNYYFYYSNGYVVFFLMYLGLLIVFSLIFNTSNWGSFTLIASHLLLSFKSLSNEKPDHAHTLLFGNYVFLKNTFKGQLMAIRSYTFQKKQGENLKQFDSRINNMSPVHAGYAYFGARAYEALRSFYGLYIVWEGKFNSSMNQPLTEQGYVMVCSEEDVKLFYELSHALPVYVKVQSKNGCIYAKDIYIKITKAMRN